MDSRSNKVKHISQGCVGEGVFGLNDEFVVGLELGPAVISAISCFEPIAFKFRIESIYIVLIPLRTAFHGIASMDVGITIGASVVLTAIHASNTHRLSIYILLNAFEADIP